MKLNLTILEDAEFRNNLNRINQEIIKNINEPSISFEEYYKQYLMKIQDYCLDLEAEYQLKNQALSDQYKIIDRAFSEVLRDDINNNFARTIQ